MFDVFGLLRVETPPKRGLFFGKNKVEILVLHKFKQMRTKK